MKEKELRLALVCYGGVSLAVYMHGITKEIQKLVRASSLLHREQDLSTRLQSTYRSVNQDHNRETDTEAVYYDILRTIGATMDMRVIVDIIAGASAGGINGIMLARAITEDLALDPLRTLWLENADVEKLLDPDAISSKWSKFYMRPILWLLNIIRKDGLDEELGKDVAIEVRMKLSRFIRSRWFKPPFSGVGFAKMLFEAVQSLGAPDPRSKALLPPGYPFDLFVTVTDFYGHQEILKLNSPAEIQEREHRMVLGFHESGRNVSGNRSLGDLADLAFAARCTASFPGAFPPATLAEMDRALRKCNYTWRGRTPFSRRAFADILASGGDPESAAFVDGSVLNNKPFGQAISALSSRPAYREVDRRIVYIEPNPMRSSSAGRGVSPGFFQSIRASLSDIPRNQPIRDDLDWLATRSDQAKRTRQVLEGMSDDVDAAIEKALEQLQSELALDAAYLKSWRNIVHQLAAQSSGFAYGPYVELKVSRVKHELCLHLSDFLRARPGTSALQPVTARVSLWSDILGLTALGRIIAPKQDEPAPNWVTFLGDFDLSYRVRRLRFLIRRLNSLYADDSANLMHASIDSAKQKIYAALAPFVTRLGNEWLSEAERDAIATSLRNQNRQDATAIEQYRSALDLRALDAVTDQVVSAILSGDVPEIVRLTIMRAYLGFSFYDIAMLPMLQSDGLDEFDAIKVDRISPEDCSALRRGNAISMLKGIRFGNFGAFFSRAYRENDYLWGRLHGAERLIDIVLSSIDSDMITHAQVETWKLEAFRAIIAREKSHLPRISSTLDQLERELA